MTDVLIIGSGGAGLSAALSAKQNNAQVIIASKTYLTHSQTCQAQGGINAVLNTSNDSIQNFYADTKKASHNLSNEETLKYFCEEASKTINWLDNIGVPFTRNEEDQIAQRKFGGTKAIRTCYSSDYTGLKILHTLYDNCIKNDIKFLNEYHLLEILTKKNKAYAARFYIIKTGEIKTIYAKAIILATGGYGSLYSNFTTNSYASTGDGIIAAYKAGAKLSNLEFVQFHPTTLDKKRILISESARGEGGHLLDEKSERFIDELKPRDEVSREIYKRNMKNEKVYLDLRHLGIEKINEAMPQERRLAYEFLGLKMEEDLIPITPSAHYSMGGILTNSKTETSIENLFACGECAQSGIHGANRLGGNSLQEIITFGRLAGKNASKNKDKSLNITEENKEENKDINKILKQEDSINFYEIKEEIGRNLFESIGLFRDEKNMQNTLDKIYEYEKELPFMGVKDKSKIYNKNLCEFLEFKNILELSKLITLCALNRKESRGAHFRTDYPLKDEAQDKLTLVYLKEDSIIVKQEEIS